jgi:putative chitinase
MSKENTDILLREALRSGITDKRELAVFMGQMQHESTNFSRMTENLNYSPERLLQVFGPYTDKKGVWHDGRNGLTTIEEARAITAGGAEGVGNAMYGGAWGAKNLGNTQEGDGWTFRGRGFTQLTGREAYETMGNKLGIDLVNKPELAADPEIAAKIAVQYWKDRVVSKGHQFDVDAATKDINGGTNGLADRRASTKEWERKIDQGYLEQIGKVQPTPGGQGQSPKPTDPMADGVLERGEKGPAVKSMQEQLIKAGITQVNGKPFTADSDYGPQTEAAVREYQRTRGLKVDGEAGPNTLDALKNNMPPKVQGGQEQTQGNGVNWPAPGNHKINQADKEGEGHGEFGTSRGGGKRTHKGVDIEGSVGDPIESFRPGTVIAVKPNNGAAGNMVVIDHGNGVTSSYMHLDKIHAKVGQKVPEDIEVIGTMGRSGNTPKAGDTHLHFEIRKDGVAVDPMPYLKGAKDIDGPGKPSDPSAPLKQGDKGVGVEHLQTRLNDLGYTDAAGNKLKPDSDYGSRTKQAVEQFQRENGLTVTGVADKDTMRLVEKGMTRHAAADGELKPGEKGPDVRGFQTSLNELGYKGADGKPLKVDGEYGGNTQAAVSAFQKANGLPETGIADKATLDKVGVSLEDKQRSAAAPTPEQKPSSGTSLPGDQHPPKIDPTATSRSVAGEHGHHHAPTAVEPERNRGPLISDASHPDNKLYTQALSRLVEMGPSGGFKSQQDMERAAAAVAADAKLTGLTQIDHIKPSKTGEGLIAIQGNDPWAPEAKRAFIDTAQATSQSIDQSTKMANSKATDRRAAAESAAKRLDRYASPERRKSNPAENGHGLTLHRCNLRVVQRAVERRPVVFLSRSHVWLHKVAYRGRWMLFSQ